MIGTGYEKLAYLIRSHQLSGTLQAFLKHLVTEPLRKEPRAPPIPHMMTGFPGRLKGMALTILLSTSDVVFFFVGW